MAKQQKEKTGFGHKALTVIGALMCIILTPILVINLTLIAKSYLHQDEVPSVGGWLPLIVLTDSMQPVINGGDLIICHTAQPEDILVNDIIAFFDPAGNGTSIVTHRVIEIVEENGELSFRTKGDNNNAEDKLLVSENNLVAIYKTRIAGAGNIAMFMQSPTGLIVCVVLPIVMLVGYDLIRRKLYERKRDDDTAALMAELEALRAEKASKKD